MIRSNSDRLLDLKSLCLMALVLIPTNLLLLTTQFGSLTPESTKEFINHKARRSHAIELLGKKAAKMAGAENHWVPGVMEAYIEKHLRTSLPTADVAKSSEIASAIVREAKAHDFDPLFVLAVIKRESGFNPRAVGGHGEIGMMQIKPSTARWISEKFGMRWKSDESLFDPIVNIQVSTTYLAHLRESFNGRAAYYVAAYNMGPNRARALMAENVVPEVYAGEVIGNYRSFYNKIGSGRKMEGRFSISMVQASRGLAFSQIAN
jgi:soluble lytic murein transglycosylase